MALNWFTENETAEALPAVSSAADRLHAIVASLEADLSGNWAAYSTVERQHILTSIAQAKQAEVLVSARVRKPEDPLDHRHNSLIATTAQSVLVNSLKADENSFRRSQASILPQLRKLLDEAKAKRDGVSTPLIETNPTEL